MSFTRAQGLDHLVNEFGALAVEARQVQTDTGDGYGPALDRALRALGVSEAAIPTGYVNFTNVEPFLALAEYYALIRIWRKLSVRGDVDARSVIGPRSQIVQQVRDLVADAKQRCAALGYSVDAPAEWEAGVFTLGYIEPYDITVQP